ncbi:MAG: Wzz/FepE/Etk N-terminal domain-containing protein [Burkholderiales bacterium]|nr:Wzz/FepE/Etk N-terminal domain-containing protein [Burkholderiales bacterium]
MSEESLITNHQSPITSVEPPDDDEINLIDLAIVLAKHKKLILGLPFLAAVLAVIVSLLMTPIFTATTKILPPQQSQSTASAMLNQLGAVAGLAGGVAGIKNPNDMYVAMLKSRTVADNLIQRFDLNKLYGKEYQSHTRKQLENVSTITSGKDGIISIAVDDKDPKRAATLANAYVEELDKLTNVLAVTEAAQRRLFFERQLEQAKVNLTKSEATARQALEKGGLVQVEGQGRSMAESSARLRAQITVKEVQIGAMRTFAAERNPDLLMAQQELEAMKRQLAKIEGAAGKPEDAQKTNSEGIDNLGLLRDLKYNETVYELLAQQYGLAKIDEAKDSSIIQVMDKAIEPDRRSSPKRALIVILTALVAGFLAVIWAFIKEAGQKARQNPEQAARLDLLRRYLLGR